MTDTMNPGESPRRDTKPRSARRRAREFVLQAVYAWLLNGPDRDKEQGAIEAHVREDTEFAEADRVWFNTLWTGVLQNADDLRAIFAPFVDRPIDELSPVEHGILLIGSFELVHKQDVPYRVAINESVELAKSFGGTDGFKFINGVLDKVAAQVREAEVRRATQGR
ncbi:transcription antitermination factor NusB [Orrella marina]|nr:transcription antitermination factor NusB [Orrella marina]